jgi:V8-like Glu-specific endopeptidase
MGSEDRKFKRILYEITTYPGESGCPVILGTKLHDKVIAIHKGGNQSLERNYGRLITLDLLIDIEIWREEINASPFKAIDLCNSV